MRVPDSLIHPVNLDESDTLDPVLERIGDATFVLLGEATHGTHEFYQYRAMLTRRLIEERGFDAVAVEADWPDANRINRYIRNRNDDDSAEQSLSDFQRFPQWMWRNTAVVDLVEHLREINDQRDRADRVGFYGLDLYSLFRSMQVVIDYLEEVDPEAAERARERYGCFDHGLEDPQQYGYQASVGMRPECQDEAVRQLVDLRRKAADYLSRDGLLASDEQFFAEQNARVVENAERYYREMFTGRTNTWNLRDTHMSETLQSLHRHLRDQDRPGRIVVWAHNSHLGDARQTSMGDRGEHNLGQLTREAAGDDAVLIGFSTFDGTVAAASNWDAPVELKNVRPAIDGSIEAACHAADTDEFFVATDELRDHDDRFDRRMYERAIGVIYRPETEMQSHYFRANPVRQFDGIVHFDRSHAVQPLDLTPDWQRQRVPETYPFGV